MVFQILQFELLHTFPNRMCESSVDSLALKDLILAIVNLVSERKEEFQIFSLLPKTVARCCLKTKTDLISKTRFQNFTRKTLMKLGGSR